MTAVLRPLLLILLLTFHTHGWWCMGHMTIAEIAKSVMSSETYSYVESMINPLSEDDEFHQSPDFVQCACWADDLKSDKLTSMATWHFINRPYDPSGFPISQSPVQEENVETLISQLDDTLKRASNKYIMTFALANLIHFYGDSHQPLHVVEMFSAKYPGGDHGGNMQVVYVDGTETKLHFIWDSICWEFPNSPNRPLNTSGLKMITDYAQQLKATYTFSDTEKKNHNATAFTIEGYNDAIKYAYPGTYSGMTITKEYRERCKPVAEARVALAGYRLGYQLEYLLRDAIRRPHREVAKDIHRFIFSQRNAMARHVRLHAPRKL